jgi:hypothetical protein
MVPEEIYQLIFLDKLSSISGYYSCLPANAEASSQVSFIIIQIIRFAIILYAFSVTGRLASINRNRSIFI